MEKGAKIINMSLGLSYYEPMFPQVFDILVNQYGILPVVAIGNENLGFLASEDARTTYGGVQLYEVQ